jgi:hypothetical protein
VTNRLVPFSPHAAPEAVILTGIGIGIGIRA